jgi:CubicO group peptidase (beta-lactamase class C family)
MESTQRSGNERWLAGLLGADFLLWSPNIQAEGYLRWREIFATRTVRAGTPIPLAEAPASLATEYNFNGRRRTIDDLMAADHLSGLLVLHDGQIKLERYALGLEPTLTWQSSSMVKSLTSTLIGAALHDACIRSLDELIQDRVPELKVNPAYEDVTLRHLLQMSSGVRFNEDYTDMRADVNVNYLKPIGHRQAGAILGHLQRAPRLTEPGTQFAYNTGDVFLLSLALSRATGRTVAEYCSERIWRPMGMETDGYFMLESDDGDEITGSCCGASLRDYARFGQLIVNDGVAASGQRVLPEGWVAEAATASAPNFNFETWDVPGEGLEGYGYLWWVHRPDTFLAWGFAGQWIYVVPKERLVVVMIGAMPQGPYVNADEPMAQGAGNLHGTLERISFIDAVRAELSVYY